MHNKNQLIKEAKKNKQVIHKPGNMFWGLDSGMPSAMGEYARSKQRSKKKKR